jgi:NAD(P)-dependent dehydrogenase (short-subunit alcohol dehydrogenase family)
VDLGLKDKRVVVTGSSRGIGFAVAKAFLDEGARVILNGVDPERLREARDQMAAHEGRVWTVAADLSASANIGAFFAELDRLWGGVDVFVNNAAIHRPSNFATLPEAEWDRLMDTNLKAAFLCAQQAFQRMKTQGGGVILNASSFAAFLPAYPYGLYSAAKAALINMTQTMAAEFAPYNIRVNAYVPGTIATAMNADNLARNHERVFAQIALKRAGTADEVAWPVVFLASERAAYITGIALDISGGKFSVQHPGGIWDAVEAGEA